VFHSLVLAVDLTVGFERVIDRAVRLPLAPGAKLRLIHVVPNALAMKVQPTVRDARAALESLARRATALLPETVSMHPTVKIGVAAAEIAECADAVSAEVVLLGRAGTHSLRDTLLGSTAERVVRESRCPVLIVRKATRGRYQRPVLALALDDAAPAVIGMARRIVPAPPAPIPVVHAYSAPFEGIAYPSLTGPDRRAYRDALRKATHAELGKVLASRDDQRVDRTLWELDLRYGPPRLVVPMAVANHRADLLLLGTQGYSSVARVFLGSVANDVVRDVACDVLVVPPQRRRTRGGARTVRKRSG
jgi:nucleotide-binding universal stress UspA family protein